MNDKIKKAFAFLTIIWMSTLPLACENTHVYVGQKVPSWNQPTKETMCVDVARAQLPRVLEAIHAWDSAISNWKRLVPKIGKDLDLCDYVIVEVEPEESVSPMTLATTSSIRGRLIKLYRGRYEVDALSVVLHEIGHALGARHMSGTMMNPQIMYNIYKCPDAATVAQVAVANDLDPSTLSWCMQK